jgi:DNA-directed RNA polymerase subunit L
MEIKVLESEKNKLKFEIVGKSHTLANLITKELWNDDDVVVSGYNVKHPQTSNVVVIIQTNKKDPKKVLLEALNNLKKRSSEFKSQFKKIAK